MSTFNVPYTASPLNASFLVRQQHVLPNRDLPAMTSSVHYRPRLYKTMANTWTMRRSREGYGRSLKLPRRLFSSSYTLQSSAICTLFPRKQPAEKDPSALQRLTKTVRYAGLSRSQNTTRDGLPPTNPASSARSPYQSADSSRSDVSVVRTVCPGHGGSYL